MIIFVVVVVFAFFVLFKQVKVMHLRMDDLEQDFAELHNAQAFCCKPSAANASSRQEERAETDGESDDSSECSSAHHESSIIGTLYTSTDTTPVCVIKEEDEEEDESSASDADASPPPPPAPVQKQKRAPISRGRRGASKKASEVNDACHVVDEIIEGDMRSFPL